MSRDGEYDQIANHSRRNAPGPIKCRLCRWGTTVCTASSTSGYGDSSQQQLRNSTCPSSFRKAFNHPRLLVYYCNKKASLGAASFYFPARKGAFRGNSTEHVVINYGKTCPTLSAIIFLTLIQLSCFRIQ